MGFYDDHAPPHGHRTPADLAEDEMLEALHGNVCAPGHVEPTAASAPSVEGSSATRKVTQETKAMTTATITATPVRQTTHPKPGQFRQLFRPGGSFELLLAIENDDNARPAICVADALTARGAAPRVISAAEIMIPAPDTPNSMVFYAEAALGEDFHYQRRRSLSALISKATGLDKDWPITSIVGNAALSIVDEAEARNCDLIVMGIHRHGALEQALGENTATRVMGRASMPVLGVRGECAGLPTRIMVATDFGDASREAAHIAANLAEPNGTVILVHATIPSPVVEEGDEGAALVQRAGIEYAFAQLCEDISKDKSIRVETVTRNGDAGNELIAAAKIISPDLITIASQRHHLITRLLLGSVTRKLAREGTWSMLVTPPLNHR